MCILLNTAQQQKGLLIDVTIGWISMDFGYEKLICKWYILYECIYNKKLQNDIILEMKNRLLTAKV